MKKLVILLFLSQISMVGSVELGFIKKISVGDCIHKSEFQDGLYEIRVLKNGTNNCVVQGRKQAHRVTEVGADYFIIENEFIIPANKIKMLILDDWKKRVHEHESLLRERKQREAQESVRKAAEAEEQRRKQEEQRRKQEADAAVELERRRHKAELKEFWEERAREQEKFAKSCPGVVQKVVKSNMRFHAGENIGNPKVIMLIRFNDDRTIQSFEILSPSEFPAFDKAAERAMYLSTGIVFPPGCPKQMELHWSLRGN
jgi:hypothetical protein